jgi:hypothetical protein
MSLLGFFANNHKSTINVEKQTDNYRVA